MWSSPFWPFNAFSLLLPGVGVSLTVGVTRQCDLVSAFFLEGASLQEAGISPLNIVGRLPCHWYLLFKTQAALILRLSKM